MDGCINIFRYDSFADKDCVLVVVSVPWNESYKDVSSECKFTVVCARTVGKDIVLLDNIAHRYKRTLVHT